MIIENITGHDGTEQPSESGGEAQKNKLKNGLCESRARALLQYVEEVEQRGAISAPGLFLNTVGMQLYVVLG